MKFFFKIYFLSFVVVLAFLIVQPQSLFAEGDGLRSGITDRGLTVCDGTIDDPCTFNKLLIGINGIINYIIYISIPIAMILFAYAGFLYITAVGNTGKIEKAHDIFKDVIVGFLIVLSAWLIVNTIVQPLISDEYETLLEE